MLRPALSANWPQPGPRTSIWRGAPCIWQWSSRRQTKTAFEAFRGWVLCTLRPHYPEAYF